MSNVLRISEAASLALHAMAYLAGREGETVAVREIAGTIQASEAHLSKVLQKLAREGLTKPVRGPTGGFRLARPPQEIALLQIYEAIEGKFECVACLLHDRVCSGTHCVFGELVGSINARVYSHLRKTRLSDLAKPRKEKRTKA